MKKDKGKVLRIKSETDISEWNSAQEMVFSVLWTTKKMQV